MRVRPGRCARAAYRPDRANRSAHTRNANDTRSCVCCSAPSTAVRSSVPSPHALMQSAVKMARKRPRKSRPSSDATRASRRRVSIRSTKASAGGRLRRMSCGSEPGGVGGSSGPPGSGPPPGGWGRVGASAPPRALCMCVPLTLTRRRCIGAPRPFSAAGAGERRDAGLVDRALEAVAQLDGRRPPEQVASPRDVGPALLGVVGRQRLVDDLRARAGHVDHGLGEFEQRELVGVPDVHRIVLTGLGQGDDPADEIVDVAERPRLAAVAEHGDRTVGQRLAQERRDRAAVVRAHPRPIRVEDPDDRRVHALLAVVGHRQRLGVALGLVVDAARADRIDVAPVALGLRMDLRVAVHLARRGQQEPRPMRLGQPQRVVRPVRADLQRVQRQAQVVDRRRRRGQVVDEVDRLLDEVRLDDVGLHEHELRRADVLDVGQRTGLDVVDADHAMSAAQELVAQMRPQEPRATGHEAGGHGATAYDVCRKPVRRKPPPGDSAGARELELLLRHAARNEVQAQLEALGEAVLLEPLADHRAALAAGAALAAALLRLHELGHAATVYSAALTGADRGRRPSRRRDRGPPMPDPAFVDRLNEQIGYEFGASQQYVAAAVYYDNETLPRLAAFFYAQALEERNHAMMMVKYLMDADAKVVIPGIDAPQSDFADIVAPVQVALEQEKRVTGQINALAALAREHGDYSSEQFMQWFIKEQIEEVASMSDLLRVVERSRENPMFAEDFLAREQPGAEGEDATAPAAAGGAV